MLDANSAIQAFANDTSVMGSSGGFKALNGTIFGQMATAGNASGTGSGNLTSNGLLSINTASIEINDTAVASGDNFGMNSQMSGNLANNGQMGVNDIQHAIAGGFGGASVGLNGTVVMNKGGNQKSSTNFVFYAGF